jgi:hypothetical protein
MNTTDKGRTKFLKLRVSDEELSKLKRLGKPAGGISVLIRTRVLGTESADAKRNALRELARLARHCNALVAQTRRFEPTQVVQILAHLLAIERELIRAVETVTTKS